MFIFWDYSTGQVFDMFVNMSVVHDITGVLEWLQKYYNTLSHEIIQQATEH